jgi:adenylate cyclase
MNDAHPSPPVSEAPAAAARPRRRLFAKYLTVFASLITAAVLITGALDIYFAYREDKATAVGLQRQMALAAAAEISHFVRDIESQVTWLNLAPPWDEKPQEGRRLDAFKLLRQAPAITEIVSLDGRGRERLRISRLRMDRIESRADLSADPRFLRARIDKVYFGPVYFQRGSEPYMSVAVAGPRRASGVTIAEVNLKLIWDIISRMRIGKAGRAFVIDGAGQLVAHPDNSLVLRKTSLARLPQVQDAIARRPLADAVAKDERGRTVLTAYAPIPRLGWFVFTERPLSEAFAPLYAALWRTGALLVAGLAVSLLASALLARRMVGPVRALQRQAARIGAGDLSGSIDLKTGDEIELLGDQINRMAADLKDLQSRSERLGRLKRFLSPQIAEAIETSGGDDILASHRREITVVFCDLRGFTAFADNAEPEEVMGVMRDYHAALGALIYRYEGTLERFVGDGLMVLFNDPLPCPDPALRAIRMADEMRARIAELKGGWQRKGHALEFGVGIAQGFCTLGRIGFEGRFDYAAIGNVPNMASRLCDLAKGGQILISQKVYADVHGAIDAEPLGEIALKGFQRPAPVYNVRGLAGAAGGPAGEQSDPPGPRQV